ncbi:hypothetical protein PL826_02330, partial [Bifidobacterium bifidum]|uniref:hypothetical protein n=1 Tax=Bifidobacterium bifidum TaxID=1681 RepID=UPI001E3A26BE
HRREPDWHKINQKSSTNTLLSSQTTTHQQASFSGGEVHRAEQQEINIHGMGEQRKLMGARKLGTVAMTRFLRRVAKACFWPSDTRIDLEYRSTRHYTHCISACRGLFTAHSPRPRRRMPGTARPNVSV